MPYDSQTLIKFLTGPKTVGCRGQSFKLTAEVDGICCFHLSLCIGGTAFQLDWSYRAKMGMCVCVGGRG